jgi:hypothetical protein
MVFKEDGKIQYLSAGYVADRFTGDTTNGLGAIFGKYETIGVPLSALGLGQVGNKFLGKFQKLSDFLPKGVLPRSFSAEKDIPKWWKDKRRGNEV